MLLEMSNARQSEPQRADFMDLNLHVNLPAIRHAPCSFTAWALAASLAGNQPLYRDTMPLSLYRPSSHTCMYCYYSCILHNLLAMVFPTFALYLTDLTCSVIHNDY